MNKIRTSILTAAVAGGSILGLVGVTGAVNAADDAVAESPAAGLVDDGTELTDAERAERREARQEARQADRQALAELLGVDVEGLVTQVRDGSTLADIAETNGVATSDVVDLIVDQKTDRIDQAVENGYITAEQATEKAAELEERVQTRVDEGRPERGEGEGRRGFRGDRGNRGGQQAPDGGAVDGAADGGDAEG